MLHASVSLHEDDSGLPWRSRHALSRDERVMNFEYFTHARPFVRLANVPVVPILAHEEKPPANVWHPWPVHVPSNRLKVAIATINWFVVET